MSSLAQEQISVSTVSVVVPAAWNSLPDHLCHITDTGLFKSTSEQLFERSCCRKLLSALMDATVNGSLEMLYCIVLYYKHPDMESSDVKVDLYSSDGICLL